MDKFKDVTDEGLATLAVEKRTAFDALVALDAPTIGQVDQAESLAVELDEIVTEQTDRETAAAAAGEKFAALKARKFGKKDDADDADDQERPIEGTRPAEDAESDANDAPDEVEGDPEDVEKEADRAAKDAGNGAPQSTARSQGVATLARKTARPVQPKQVGGTLMINAAPDVPQFSAGSEMDGISQLSEAVINRMRGFTAPSGDGKTENLQKFGVASIKRPFTDELTIDRGHDDMEVLNRASKESRLDGGSLTAAGGWCAPSETIYDLCSEGESLEGLVSLPEVNIKRGGINYTRGPDFATFYGTADAFWTQTETQAIAGATKPCVTIACPAFTEVRLDAVGLCIKIPILTQAAYPELVQRYVSGYLMAYQHRMSAETITRVLALTPAARVITGLGSSVYDTIAGLSLLADERRQKYRMSMTATMEVWVPFWMKNAFLNDLSIRNGRGDGPATEQELNSYFTSRHLNVQYLYNWQSLALNANAYPTTYQALMFPAGTFIKGTTDIINLSAVYDAASLAVNVYTGLFMEEGLLVAKMCNDADLVTLPICGAGRTGAANFTCA